MKKRILMVVYTIYPFDARVRREAEALAAQPDLEVTVLCLKQSTNPRKYTLEGVAVEELNEGKYQGSSTLAYIFSYIKFTWLAFWVCMGRFFQHKVDIVHVHNMPNFLIFSGAVPRLFGKKLVLDLHDSVPETFGAKFNHNSHILFKLFCLEEKISCKFAQNLICVNHVQRDVIVGRGIEGDKILISINVPDPKWFSLTSPTTRYKDHNHFRLVYHGTVTRRLGIDLAIRTTLKLRDKINGIELHIWGGGDAWDECRQIVEKAGILDTIYFHKEVLIEILRGKLSSMDVGIIPNRKNSATQLMLPVKMLEYVALGIPVVAPRLKAIQYYFTEEMVSYYEPEDIDSMAGAILRLYKDATLRESQAEKAKAFLEEYGWEKHKMGLIDLYTKLLG